MERILLEVSEQTAKAWRNTAPELRAGIEKNLDKILSSALEGNNEIHFEMLLQDARETAAKNGLTPEILASLLDEED